MFLDPWHRAGAAARNLSSLFIFFLPVPLSLPSLSSMAAGLANTVQPSAQSLTRLPTNRPTNQTSQTNQPTNQSTRVSPRGVRRMLRALGLHVGNLTTAAAGKKAPLRQKARPLYVGERRQSGIEPSPIPHALRLLLLFASLPNISMPPPPPLFHPGVLANNNNNVLY